VVTRTAGGAAPGKVALRALLGRNGPRLGLTAGAVEQLVQKAQITHWRAGQQIFAPGEAHDLVSFLVTGAVRVVCRGERGATVTVQIVRPGQFFGLASLLDPVPRPRLFGAVAHVDAMVAMVSHDTMVRVLDGLPPRRVLRVMAYTWSALSRLLYEKSLLLTMPLQARVLHVLRRLGRDFGVEHPDGTVVDLPLTQSDLAEMVVASRANVSRCLAALRRARLIDVRDRRILLTPRFPVAAGRRRRVPIGT
jgi:CRP/FNR family transcriptional regulator